MTAVYDFEVEVRKILTCRPYYTPCLKNFHNRLQKVKKLDLLSWARGNVCQLKGLAVAVIEGSDQQLQATDIILELFPVDEFRQHVCDLKPDLLSTLLRNTTEVNENFDKHYQRYGRFCAAVFLSEPQRAVPVGFANFFEAFVKWLVDNVSEDTLSLLLQILQTASLGQVGGLSGEILKKIQNEGRRLLKSCKDRLMELRCLALLENLSRLRQRLQRNGFVLPGDTLRVSEEMFDSSSAQHILGLLLSGAIATLGSAVRRTPVEQSVESLQLAIDIAGSLVAAGRTGPGAKHQNALTQKLLEKSTIDNLDSEIRARGLELYLTLCDQSAVHESVSGILKLLLLDGSIQRISSSIIQRVAPCLNQSFVITLLQQSCNLASQEETSHPILRQIEGALHVLEALNGEPAIAQSMSELVWSANLAEGFCSALEAFTATVKMQDKKESEHAIASCCPGIVKIARTSLRQRFRTFLLLSAFNSQHRNSMNAPIVTRLLVNTVPVDKAPIEACSLISQDPRQLVTTPRPGRDQDLQLHVNSRNWRDVLAEQSLVEANRKHLDTVKIVGEVCRDLEKRCESIEQPLLLEDAQIQRLETQLNMACKNEEEMRHHLRESQQTSELAQREYQAMSVKLASSESCVDKLSEQLSLQGRENQALEKNVEKISDSAARAIQQADVRNMELVQERDRIADENQQETTRLLAEVQALKQTSDEYGRSLDISQKMVADRDQTISRMLADLDEMSSKLTSSQSMVETLRTELQRAEDDRKTMISTKLAIVERHAVAIGQTQQLLNNANDEVDSIRTAMTSQQCRDSGVRIELEAKLALLRTRNTELEQLKLRSEATSTRKIDALQSRLKKETNITKELRRCIGNCGPGADYGDMPHCPDSVSTKRMADRTWHDSPLSSPVRAPTDSRKRLTSSRKSLRLPHTTNFSQSPRRGHLQPFKLPLADKPTAHNRGSSLPTDMASRRKHRFSHGSPGEISHDSFDPECESTRYGSSQIMGDEVAQSRIEARIGASPRCEIDKDETRAD